MCGKFHIPLGMVRLGSYFCVKNLTSPLKHCINNLNLCRRRIKLKCVKLAFWVPMLCKRYTNDYNRQTDRQTDRQILWHHIRGYVEFFFHLNLLPSYLLRSQGVKEINFWINDLTKCTPINKYAVNKHGKQVF